MLQVERDYNRFKRAVLFSIAAHIMLFILLLLSPQFPKPSRKGMIHYVNVISFPGGGGGGRGSSAGGTLAEEKIEETPVPQRESLRDLTTPQTVQQEAPSTFRYPVEKPEREEKAKPEKKTAIQKPSETPSKNTRTGSEGKDEASGSGTGSGVRIGIGPGYGSGGGFGSEYSSQIGLSSFPFTYYLQIIQARISNNWFKSQVTTGITADFHTTIFFKIYKDGQISNLEIEETSTIKSLDLSALRAIQSSVPFPPLPKEYEGEYLGIHIIFEHSK